MDLSVVVFRHRIGKYESGVKDWAEWEGLMHLW